MPSVFIPRNSTALKIRFIDQFLGAEVVSSRRRATHTGGWGYKPTGRRAAYLSKKHAMGCFFIEDGFLALAPGMDAATQRLSLAIDEQAPYFDTSRPTDLEGLILSGGPASFEAKDLFAMWLALPARKYDHLTPVSDALPPEVQQAAKEGRQVIVLIDQLAGDASLREEYAGPRPFQRMLDLARMSHPGALLVIKPHPRAGAARWLGPQRQGALESMKPEGVLVCHRDISLSALCQVASKVYTVTSHAGFEALARGASVVCVGHPWYAGWGLTHDCFTPARRAQLPTRSVAQLFWAAYAQYCRYVHPAFGVRVGLRSALEHLRLQQDVRARTPRKIAIINAQRWKADYYRDFFPGAALRFEPEASVGREVGTEWTLLVWGQRVGQAKLELWRRQGFTVLQAEDGFLRSNGLGCELTRPLSLSFDPQGLYADPRTTSRLIDLVKQPLSEENELAARRFCGAYRRLRLTKYVIRQEDSAIHWSVNDRITAAALRGRKLIVLCGQVADDVSLRASGCKFATFEQLARHIKTVEPDTLLVYRPHPDVVKGLRPGELAVPSADINDSRTPTRMLCEEAHEVHVINSLMGFESLMLGKPVSTWGRAWYAGWGLTRDAVQEPREQGASLLALVHAAYFAHPLYFDWRCRQFLSPPDAANLLAQRRSEPAVAPGPLELALKALPRPLVKAFWAAASAVNPARCRMLR